MSLLDDIRSIDAPHLRRLSLLNLFLPLFVVLSLTYDLIYLGFVEAISGAIFFGLAFVLVFFSRRGSTMIRWSAGIWLALVALLLIYIIGENLMGHVEGVPRGMQFVVALVGMPLLVFSIYGFLVLTSLHPATKDYSGTEQE